MGVEDFWKGMADEEAGVLIVDELAAVEDEDTAEILELIPQFRGDVLELAAGSGRLTGYLAKKADSVVALDFRKFSNSACFSSSVPLAR